MPAPRTPVRSAARPTPRPVVDAREAQALREAITLRQLAAARPDLTPAQLAAARAALAAKAAPRPAGKRSPTTKRPAAKRPAATRSRTGAGATERTGARWSSRLGVVALGTLLVPALVTVVLPGATTPSGGPLDVTALALTARSSLLEAADGYRALEQTAAHRRDQLTEARAAEQAARDAVDDVQQAVGTSAADLYRATPAARYPVPTLDAPGAGVLAQELAADADQAVEATVVRAERTAATLADAEARVDRAEAVAADADAELAAALDRMRAEVDDLSTEVTGRLAALGTIPAAGQQQERNQRAVARWQGYLAELTGAGVELPAAADLTDPADLPEGLSPALDADGRPVPGVAWAVAGSSPVTVLPSETVAAVSNALSQLGKPYVAGAAGPETYDCGGFTAASWLLGGYALPATPQQQWATGTAVPLDGLQIGDLVFSPGGQDVGMYLGDGDVLGASAATYQVGIRSVAAGSAAVRVPVAPTGTPNAALPAGGPTGPCGAPLATPGSGSPRWGGWDNGEIPTQALCQLGVHRHALRCDAAAGYAAMGEAYEAEFGTELCLTDSYRSLASQVDAFSRKPALAAVPGTSNHGWALAVDLCGGIHRGGSEQWRWMAANAGRFGFVQPDWASPGGEKPEPWHWEYGYIS
ncbi:NlpC/P60 family protein [Blastococcus sp. TF02-9]|uniref:NlpC/P60 family protein n=1 Tax=Blastococcus sp. TF02-09 TaxID=2250576 RepID=UPI0026BB6A5C|nr:NlpC/P60 family protein [Blastococcus sp. TF02-9]